jgi:hypothetical protein
MDVKQFKDLKDNLNQKLYTMFRDLVQGGEIQTLVQDDLEKMRLTIVQEKQDASNNSILIESIFYFNILDADNINCKLNNRTVLLSPNGGIVGTVSDYSQIDLETIVLVKEKFIEFAKLNKLIEDDAVGVGDQNDAKTTP